MRSRFDDCIRRDGQNDWSERTRELRPGYEGEDRFTEGRGVGRWACRSLSRASFISAAAFDAQLRLGDIPVARASAMPSPFESNTA